MSLQDLCIQNIAASIQESPPMIQEIIIGRTTEEIKKEIKKELTKELTRQIIKNEKKTMVKEITVKLKHMVPTILCDIIASEQQGRPRTNFRARFWDEDEDIVNNAIEIAEELVDDDIVRYTTSSRNSYNIEMDSDSDNEYTGDGWY